MPIGILSPPTNALTADDANGNVMPAQPLADFKAQNATPVYTCSEDFQFAHNGVTITIHQGVPFPATPDLLAALTVLAAPITQV